MNKNSFFTFVAGFLVATQVFAQAVKPVFPGYGACPVANNVINTDCVADVNRRYAATLDAYYRSQSLVTDSYTGTVAPIKPTYSCTVDSSGVRDNVCENAYASAINNYNIQQNAYQTIQSDQATLAQQEQAAAQTRITTVNGTSTTATLADITAKNNDASGTYKTASTLCMIGSAAAAVKFAMTCSAGSCSPGYLATSIALAAFSAMAAKQAKSHDESAYQSCVAQNQLTSSTTDCGTGTSGTAYTPDSIQTQLGQISSQIDSTTGQCKASAPASCVSVVTKANEAGIDVKSALAGASQFAGATAPFKVNKDGTITTKDGKTYSAKDFADEASMIAAGFSPADAKLAASSLSAPGGVLAAAGIDAKGDLKDLAKTDFGSFAAMNSSGGTSGSGDANSSSKSALGSKDLSANSRKPSSTNQGLIRSFNGDSIGIANDDIFKMMNKRYKLKSAQDAFIGP